MIPLLLGIISFLFLLIKAEQNGIRLSDTNVYIVMGQQIAQGAVVYRDMFLTNLPLFPYVSTVYLWLVGGSAELFYLTSSIEAVVIAVLLFVALKKSGSTPLTSLLASCIYLSSAIVLYTSDHQTGIFFASLCAISAYTLVVYKRFILAGIAIGCMIGAKAYFLPVLLGLCVYLWVYDRKELGKVLVSAFLTGLVIMLPTLLFAWESFMQQTFGYSLTRPAGLEKSNILFFFLQQDWVLALIALWSIVRLRANILTGSTVIAGLLFILLYADVYYFYLHIVTIFLPLALPDIVATLNKYVAPKTTYGILITVITIAALLHITSYLSTFSAIGRINNMEKLVSAVQKEQPERLFGVADIQPILSYKTGTPLVNNIIDSNDNLFIKGVYSSEDTTNSILKEKTVVITYGAYYPDYSIDEPILNGNVDAERIIKNCKKTYSHPIRAEGLANYLNVYRCYK